VIVLARRSCASAIRVPAYIANSRSGTTIAHPSMTRRCHNGRRVRSAGIVPTREMIPTATQSRRLQRSDSARKG
jgi:hypothetical protein